MTEIKKDPKPPVVLEGVSLVSGLALGYAHFEESFGDLSFPKKIEATGAEKEIERLGSALEHVRDHVDIHVQEAHAAGEKDAKAILEAHVRILDDESFFGDIHSRIRESLLSAEQAVEEAFKKASSKLAATRDPYLAARAEDLRDMCIIIRKALVYGPVALESIQKTQKPPVFFSRNLRPSYVLRARRAGASGYATACTAMTSHASILLRSSGIPAVGSLQRPPILFPPNTPVVVDGNRGRVVLWPTKEQIDEAVEYGKKRSQERLIEVSPPQAAHLPSGEEVTLLGNLDNPFQLPMCFENGLAGVGLFRTEFMVLDTGEVPDEETQFVVYSKLLKNLRGRPLTVRTFDIGGDKDFTGIDGCYGRNPAMGVRGLRRHLLYKGDELFTQLRALLRAAPMGNLEIMAPMVTTVEDVLSFKQILKKAKESLQHDGLDGSSGVSLGVMVEVPSAVFHIKKILPEVDFVSVGTNDLTQYLTASDRDNTAVLGYHEMHRSGILKVLSLLMDTVQALGRSHDVTVCGDLASRPRGAVALAALGVRRLSLSLSTVTAVRKALETNSTTP